MQAYLVCRNNLESGLVCWRHQFTTTNENCIYIVEVFIDSRLDWAIIKIVTQLMVVVVH